jgi:hypothetical protein
VVAIEAQILPPVRPSKEINALARSYTYEKPLFVWVKIVADQIILKYMWAGDILVWNLQNEF